MSAWEKRKHTCACCGHRWESLEDETAKAIQKAAEVNGVGPFCALCYHLEMAHRYANARDFRSLKAAVAFWLRHQNAGLLRMPDKYP